MVGWYYLLLPRGALNHRIRKRFQYTYPESFEIILTLSLESGIKLVYWTSFSNLLSITLAKDFQGSFWVFVFLTLPLVISLRTWKGNWCFPFKLQGLYSRVLGFNEIVCLHCLHSVRDFIGLGYVLSWF